MVKFREFISNGINENKDTELASLNVSNDEKIYNLAMKAHNSEDFKIAMMKVKSKFKDASKIKFDKVDWNEIFVDLNEKIILEELEQSEEISEELYNKIMDNFDIIIESEDTKETILEKVKSKKESKERVDNSGKPLTDEEKKDGIGICDCGNKAKLNRRGECRTCSSFD